MQELEQAVVKMQVGITDTPGWLSHAQSIM